MTSTEALPTDQSIGELLRAASAARNLEVTALAQSRFAQEQETEKQADRRFILGTEAWALMDRMSWLSRHKRIGKLTVGEAAKMHSVVSREDRGIRTSLLLPTQAEFADDNAAEEVGLGRSEVVDGFIFRHITGAYISTLDIVQELVDIDSAETETNGFWKITFEHTPEGPYGHEIKRMSFDSTAAAKERQGHQSKLLKDFIKIHPYVRPDLIKYKDGENPEIDENWFHFNRPTCEQPGAASSEEIDKWREWEWEQKEALKELTAKLARGIGWDYLEDVYSFPLGLIMQARRELQARWRKK
jgi:hypothetical protein